jgi:hypothetical protein
MNVSVFMQLTYSTPSIRFVHPDPFDVQSMPSRPQVECVLHSSMQLNIWISVVPWPPTLVGGHFISGPAGEGSKKMDIRIYVGNMGKSTTEAEINTLFAKAGEVTSVELVKDRDSGQSKGFAFVTMTNQADADKAIGMYNAYSLANNELKVNIAKPRVERPSNN